MSPIWYAQLTLNSVALVPSVIFLSTDATKTLVSAFVLSCLDYRNSLLFGSPQYPLNKLQKVQNNAACLVLRVSKTDYISPYLASVEIRMSPIWYAQLTLNSVALVPSVIFCPQMPQRLLSLPLFFHVLIIATLFFLDVLSIS